MTATEPITITHTAAEGTLVRGTRRGDGTNEILKSAGFKWFRTLGLWGIPRSRDRQPDHYRIRRAVEALTAAGHSVTEEVDASHRSVAESEADLAARQGDRAEALADKADRRAAAADAAWEVEHHASQLLPPFGQPIYVDTAGGRRVMRNVERAHTATRRALDATEEAKNAATRADVAAAAADRRHNPVTVKNRLDRIEADQRRDQRILDGYRRVVARTATGEYADEFPPATGAYRDQVVARMAQRGAEIDYWKGVYAEQQAAGVALSFSRETIAKGDQVKYCGGWWPVVRVNAKSVSIRMHEGASWTDTVAYHKLKGHRPAEGTD
ncbi:DUF3560 domain-containing protein [Mycobacterium sp. DBP42]|uniref:DUF3560 domain-containing protein n=1 Tax=Mycobacteriaceae TaxID=1762 RepID=UPI00110D1C89|nr:DUF3560 domain-containing protein [Mycobacterium sp. DBP42]TMS46988.1 DUF3560 domain-containing protein [Mycobacterium sp. DBP42]